VLEPQYLATLRIIHGHLRFVEVEQMRLPVLDLAYEYTAYLTLGRHERAELLRQWLLARNAPGSDPPAEASD
jgi:hypothetical protein